MIWSKIHSLVPGQSFKQVIVNHDGEIGNLYELARACRSLSSSETPPLDPTENCLWARRNSAGYVDALMQFYNGQWQMLMEFSPPSSTEIVSVGSQNLFPSQYPKILETFAQLLQKDPMFPSGQPNRFLEYLSLDYEETEVYGYASGLNPVGWCTYPCNAAFVNDLPTGVLYSTAEYTDGGEIDFWTANAFASDSLSKYDIFTYLPGRYFKISNGRIVYYPTQLQITNSRLSDPIPITIKVRPYSNITYEDTARDLLNRLKIKIMPIQFYRYDYTDVCEDYSSATVLFDTTYKQYPIGWRPTPGATAYEATLWNLLPTLAKTATVEDGELITITTTLDLSAWASLEGDIHNFKFSFNSFVDGDQLGIVETVIAMPLEVTIGSLSSPEISSAIALENLVENHSAPTYGHRKGFKTVSIDVGYIGWKDSMKFKRYNSETGEYVDSSLISGFWKNGFAATALGLNGITGRVYWADTYGKGDKNLHFPFMIRANQKVIEYPYDPDTEEIKAVTAEIIPTYIYSPGSEPFCEYPPFFTSEAPFEIRKNNSGLKISDLTTDPIGYDLTAGTYTARPDRFYVPVYFGSAPWSKNGKYGSALIDESIPVYGLSLSKNFFSILPSPLWKAGNMTAGGSSFRTATLGAWTSTGSGQRIGSTDVYNFFTVKNGTVEATGLTELTECIMPSDNFGYYAGYAAGTVPPFASGLILTMGAYGPIPITSFTKFPLPFVTQCRIILHFEIAVN